VTSNSTALTPPGDAGLAGNGVQPTVEAYRTATSGPPLERRGVVLRTRLLASLEAVPQDVPLILLAAPAGYGKTTALSQWAATTDRPFAWVSLHATDADPMQLALHIALALQRSVPMSAATATLLTTIPRAGRAAALPGLVRALRDLARPVVLVLDDLHEVQGRESLALVRGLVDGAPPGVHVAVAVRGRPNLGLATLRAQGRCAEFGRDELGLTEDESRQVLAATGQRCEPETVRAVVRRTEGWPAGIYLASLVARQDSSGIPAHTSPAAISGDDVYIADYFREELLALEPADNVRFLLRTSVLEQMSGPLCDALLGRRGSATRLAEAERRNLFVVPLHREGGWYRYHRLFREMLLSELRRREPGEEYRLHRRAADWYEREGLVEFAIGHALDGRDGGTAARLINSRAREFVSAGRMETVRSWLRRLDSAALDAYPPVAVTAGWIWALTGDPARAQSCLRLARAAAFEGPLPDGSPSLESAAAILGALTGPLGVDQMLEDARTAVRLDRPDNPWRPLALAALGLAHVLTGLPELATKDFTMAAALGGEGQRLAAALARAELALLALEQGDQGADLHAKASLDLVEEAGLRDNVVAMLTYAVCAWAAARRRDHESVRRLAGAAQRLDADPSAAAFPAYGAQVAIVLGRVSLELADPVATRLRIDEARQYLSRLPTQGVLPAKVDDLSERLARHSDRVGTPTAMSLTAAEVRVLQLLPTHLSLAEIAEELHVSRNTVKTQVAGTYRKLRAGTRAAAVNRGRELGLLEA
jgi:LuxR family maltose regulon positive regulatory protein